MQRYLRISAIFFCLAAISFADEPKSDKPAEPLPEVFSPPPFDVPPGFTVEVAAASPLVKHPIMAGFDDKGRLYVAENAGLNLPRVDLEKQLPNGILRLEDTDGDGKFDKQTVFADKMTFPQGALWHEGSLYVASSGGIWKLTDHNDDGVADERQLLVSKFGYTGNAADVHGCFLGPDGRIYWCEGRHGHEITDAEGKLISKGKAARVFSCKTDGSDVQVFAGGGMDNPVEVDWTEEGEMLGTVNIFYHQRGDTLVHWVRGGVYPRLDQPDCLAEFPRTGEPLDAVHDFGHVAVSGCMRYRSGSIGFGEAYANNWFVTEFNTHKVKRCVLEREGSTFKATVHEFLKAKSDDFHPTDVLEDADGSLLVVDTGGWFRIGCPTSQIAKSHILGGIYRVRKTDGKKVEDPRGLSKDLSKTIDSDLSKLLEDPRYALRQRVIEEILRHRGRILESISTKYVQYSGLRSRASAQLLLRSDNLTALTFLRQSLFPNENTARRSSLSLGELEIVTNPNGKKTIVLKTAEQLKKDRLLVNALQMEFPNGMNDAYAQIQLLLTYGLGATADEDSTRICEVILETSELAPLRREAATSLGKLGRNRSVSVLLSALSGTNDRVLEHAITYALIEIADRAKTAEGLADKTPAVRRGALIALDQMKDGNLTRDEVVALLDTTDVPLQTAAMEIISRRKWTEEVIAFAGKLLEQPELTPAQQGIVENALTGLLKETKVQELVATTLRKETLPKRHQSLLLSVLAQGDLPELPLELAEVVRDALTAPDPAVLQAAVLAAKAEQYEEPLLAIARNEKTTLETRLAAIATVAGHKKPLSETDIAWLKGQVTDGDSPISRITAARALGTAALTTDQLKVVAALIAEVGPLELSPLLAAFNGVTDDAVGKVLATALAKSPGAGSLSLTQIESLLKPFSEDARSPIQPLLEKLLLAGQEQRQRLEGLLASLDGGNIQAGRDIFVNKRAACTACHRIGSDGGKIGPDLTKVGERRSQRDLLEAVLYPSSSVGQGYETYVIQTSGGQTVTGLVTRRTAGTLFLRTTDQKDIRLATTDIEQMKASPVSIMPAGLENTMTNDQLRDLIAYLRSLK
ncbi:MAG: PVC-type heme-binding CxxCH protein [Pirellulaceae bacterium]